MVGVQSLLGREHLWQSYLRAKQSFQDSMQTTTSSASGLSCFHYLPSRMEIPKQKIMSSNFLAAAGTQLRTDLVLTMKPGCVMLGKAIAAAG